MNQRDLGIECECRYCGTVFFVSAPEAAHFRRQRPDDCGGCRLNDDQCAEYLRQRAKDDAEAEGGAS